MSIDVLYVITRVMMVDIKLHDKLLQDNTQAWGRLLQVSWGRLNMFKYHRAITLGTISTVNM
jgi:hypothetical protein